MPTSVLDTADWRCVVPLKVPLNLTGSRLTAVMTGSFGGPSAASLDSADGTIAWTADSQGLSDHLTLSVPRAARGDWLADAPITLVFDVHRTVQGASSDEWLGRSSVLVLPASDSPLVRQTSGLSPILIAGQPGTGVVLPALTTGPQGPSSTTIVRPAGAALSGHRVLRIASDGRAVYASNMVPGEVLALVGISLGAADPDAPVSIAPLGEVVEPAWTWTPGQPVWCGPNGTLVQPQPATGDLRPVGLALTATRLSVALGPPILRP